MGRKSVNTSFGPRTNIKPGGEWRATLVGHALRTHRRHAVVAAALHDARRTSAARVKRLRASGHLTEKMPPFAALASREPFTRKTANTLAAQRRNERMEKRWAKDREVA